jgi:hypothetical protein
MKKLAALIFCVALQGCGSLAPNYLPPATDLRATGSEIVVIGKIELVPPLDPALEQKAHWNAIGSKDFLNHILVSTGDEFKPLDRDARSMAAFQSSLKVEWGKPFMVKAPRQRTFLNGGVVFLDMLRGEKLWFPGGYYFDVPKDGSAVYIGTLRYYRNDFNTITRVEVVDERKDIGAVLKGGSAQGDVRPSLLKKVERKQGQAVAAGPSPERFTD